MTGYAEPADDVLIEKGVTVDDIFEAAMAALREGWPKYPYKRYMDVTDMVLWLKENGISRVECFISVEHIYFKHKHHATLYNLTFME